MLRITIKNIAKKYHNKPSSFNFTTNKRSYYDILELKPNFTSRQLKLKYLEKARKYHPDHNKSEQALEEFKLIKQAYQNLKDPQKRILYDSGVGETSPQVSPVHNHEVRQGKKYYQNKWYGFKKQNQYDMRDEYYEAKVAQFKQKKNSNIYYITSIAILLTGIFGYQLLLTKQSKKQMQLQNNKKILQNSIDDTSLSRQQLIIKKYMQNRAKLNKAQL